MEMITKTYIDIPVSEQEILHYAGCRQADEKVLALLRSCLQEAKAQIQYKVCYCVLPITIRDDRCNFSIFQVTSSALARHLKDANQVLIFAATLGVGLDRLINRYGRLSPAKSLHFQAIGAAQIEALCDQFCDDMEKEIGYSLLPRFSPGYGDLPLDVQKHIFSLLDCERKIGLTLNESLIMSPSKSVTAFVGMARQADHQ